jgi:hypothetical protein
MPLVRAAGEPFLDIEGVRFPMVDINTDEHLSCLVHFEYLQDRTGATDPNKMLGEFDMHRAEIEGLASEKYDKGQRPPRVTQDDLPS